jgi:hypothetical protein
LSPPRPNQPFVSGVIRIPSGDIPQVSSTLTLADRWGTFKARWGVGRMHYAIDPGLYALGSPDNDSPVLVTANYKMSFDCLREALPDRNVWILVLDTNGINVWCAAGKGTFGTDELILRIESAQLAKRISHRQLILPQLSGPGIAAHKVKKCSGFSVIYGPVRAADLPVFMDAGLKATPEMRSKTFTLVERAILIPVELVGSLKWLAVILSLFFITGGIGGTDTFTNTALNHGLSAVTALISAMVTGLILVPILLPYLPGRAFSLKGAVAGLIAAVIFTVFRAEDISGVTGILEILAWLFLFPAIAAYFAMNFTGSSTYTSLSGVKKEMKIALPLEIAAGAAGICLWLVSRFAA